MTCVPQGSGLCHLSFLIFIHDLPLSTKSALLDLFADDSTLHVSGASLLSYDVQSKLSEDIFNVVR